MVWGERLKRDRQFKKQGLKKPSFYDDFSKDFKTLIILVKNISNSIVAFIAYVLECFYKVSLLITKMITTLFLGLKISFIWTVKTIFKGLKWLFSYEGLKSIGSLIFALLYAVFVLISYLAAVIFAISAIIGLIAGIIDFFKLFKKD